MNCNKANEISIISFLQSQGIEPVRTTKREMWYLSPIRTERTPSFKVEILLNRWYDHGLGQGGKLVDLGIRLLGITVKEFLEIIQKSQLNSTINSEPVHQNSNSIELLEIKVIENSSLIKYLIFRNISLPLARLYCREVHYKVNSGRFFGIGFRNDCGGFEIRNPYFKGCIHSKGITSYIENVNHFSLFEGFFDFLSALQIGLISDDESVIVLNSVNQIHFAIAIIKKYSPTNIRVFFDNDLAGAKCLQSIKSHFSFAIAESIAYREYKDLNEMICKTN